MRIEIGQVFENNSGQHAVVLELLEKRKVVIRFLGTGHVKTMFRGNLPKGRFNDPTAKVIYGVGCRGDGEHLTNGTSKRAFNVWHKMLERCYDKKTQERKPSYKGCSVCDEWHNFQNFAAWYYKQPGNTTHELDKDLLVKGNKLYSPKTCTLIPTQLNIALQEKRVNSGEYPAGVYYKKKNNNFIAQLAYGDGVQKHLASCLTAECARAIYLKAKKEHLKYLADFYADEITKEAYSALCNWEPVE